MGSPGPGLRFTGKVSRPSGLCQVERVIFPEQKKPRGAGSVFRGGRSGLGGDLRTTGGASPGVPREDPDQGPGAASDDGEDEVPATPDHRVPLEFRPGLTIQAEARGYFDRSLHGRLQQIRAETASKAAERAAGRERQTGRFPGLGGRRGITSGTGAANAFSTISSAHCESLTAARRTIGGFDAGISPVIHAPRTITIRPIFSSSSRME